LELKEQEPIAQYSHSATFKPIPVTGLKPLEFRRAMRTNCLGSLFYFITQGLRRKRLVDHLHEPLCTFLERDHIKDVIEWPRDHFKSTIGSEGLPIWRVLPVSDDDLNEFSKLGYSSEFLAWLLRVHRPEARNLLVSENITNSAKLGRRIAFHYESNTMFRFLFPEIIPTTSQTWSNFSMHQRVPSAAAALSGGHGEGTFDFLGVGGALQSRHYNGLIVEDDLVGRKATESISIMEKTVEYHKLMVGAFENEESVEENDELVIGNRWGRVDLNSHIIEYEPEFRITTHSALGGCCALHPPDQPIFPEEYNILKLERWRNRLGNYLFSCQFLNNPAAPENADFHPEDLRYFSLEKDLKNGIEEWTIHHQVTDGIIKKNLAVNHLNLCLVADPNHSGNSGSGRCRHAINVVGLSSDGDFYLIDTWAQAASYDTFYAKIYEFADKWKIRKIGVESVAAQKYILHHIEYTNRLEGRNLKVIPLEGEVDAGDGGMTTKKEFRIRNVLAPIFESHKFWAMHRQQDFYGEFTDFPNSKYKDILDALAYAPQMLRLPQGFIKEMMWKAANAAGARKINMPYSIGV
jgi:hypothetical protein